MVILYSECIVVHFASWFLISDTGNTIEHDMPWRNMCQYFIVAKQLNGPNGPYMDNDMNGSGLKALQP